jgi:oxygen-independent coproporphyrinogen-3 oxidase
MDDAVLAAIGRRHTADDVLRAMERARASGIAHINMDVIAGLPTDAPAGFRRTMDSVVSLGADNITVHTLSLKKGSRIMLDALPIPSPQDVSDMLAYASEAALLKTDFIRTISTGRNTCPAALRTPAGAKRTASASTTYISWRSFRASCPWGAAA